MAGFETTSGVIVFTLLDLAQNLDVQSKLREELAHADFTTENLETLPYLDAVAREGCAFKFISFGLHRLTGHVSDFVYTPRLATLTG